MIGVVSRVSDMTDLNDVSRDSDMLVGRDSMAVDGMVIGSKAPEKITRAVSRKATLALAGVVLLSGLGVASVMQDDGTAIYMQ